MTTFASRSGPSSGIPSVSDLDGYTIRDYQFPTNYGPTQDDDFGFDPPDMKAAVMAPYQPCSPPHDPTMSNWPEFNRDDIAETTEPHVNLDSFEFDQFLNSSQIPTSETALSRFGQITPPRSSSAVSSKDTEKALSPKTTTGTTERKKTKTQAKDINVQSRTASKPGRKRKSTRKASLASEQDDHQDDSKRKQSLEKNRLAAAKCRVNKKEKTELLQRDSHEKAVENAYLKDQVMRMKDEIQQMNAILLAHANCEGCKSPEGVQAHLSQLGNDFFQNQRVDLAPPNYLSYPQMNFTDLPMMQENFFASASQGQMLHPPLPDFDRSADFEVHTPMDHSP
ncbi:hypothetical protein B0A52_01397 [Exophiala mesophila]|uniref:BZIP domain-containing protein n=1 Tax=Exophiala mesophila TaxID=212818 RepID=A0A438NHC6_EXOME|nr:hypothetical protein B0A52_01397 [Exophiala mesophila]